MHALLILLLAADPADARAEKKLVEQLLAINLEEAQKWDMFLDDTHTTKAELVERPVYLWTNPTKRFGVQHGSVFVWTHEGRPMVVGSVFAHPMEGKRRVIHEFHALTPTILSAVCKGEQNSAWQPKAALQLSPVPRAPAPEASAPRRLIQIRALAREFTGYTLDGQQNRFELRLLAQPLYRYEKPQGEIIDGALLALVTDAGTDPEVFLLLEARKAGGWHYALLRFCDAGVRVSHQEKEVWAATRDTGDVQLHNTDHTYRVFQKQFLVLEGDTTGAPPP